MQMKQVSTQDKIQVLINTRDDGMLKRGHKLYLERFEFLLHAGRLEELDDEDYTRLDNLYDQYTDL